MVLSNVTVRRGLLIGFFTVLLSHAGMAAYIESGILAQLESKYGDPAYRRGVALNKLLDELQGADLQTQLKEVNRFFNQFRYISDQKLWKQKDYWATPLEFIGKSQGDCEDFVIAKYFALRALGVDDKQIYLTYVKAVKKNIAHMVLTYYETPGGVPLVLDNYNPRILRADKRTDLVPVYSFNAQSLFAAKSAGLGQALPSDKIRNSKWDQLLIDYQRNKM